MPSSSTTAAAPREASTLARRSSSAARARPAAAAAASASPDSSPDPPPWRDEVLESHAALGNVAFVLCQPQGPQNVGSVARVMQNFGVYDLRLVDPGPFVLASAREDDVSPTDAVVPDGASSRGGVNSGAALGPDGLGDDLPPALRPTRINNGPDGYDEDGETTSDGETTPPSGEDGASPTPALCEEAYRFACAADWLLAGASRHDSVLDALADRTFVVATTARPRGGVPLVTARVAAKMLAEEARRGKVAVLFGNERTGLTNEEMAQAHCAVAIPTAGQGALCRRSLKYTGGTGPTSLNLSQAVGILAYETFIAADEMFDEADDDDAEETRLEEAPDGGGGLEGGVDAEEEASGANEGKKKSSRRRRVNAGRIDPPAATLMTVGEKDALKRELLAARRSLDVLADEEDEAGADGEEEGSSGESSSSSDSSDDDDEDLSDEDSATIRERRAIERVLHAAPLARRDAAALFQLARRITAIRRAEDHRRDAGTVPAAADGVSNRGPAVRDGARSSSESESRRVVSALDAAVLGEATRLLKRDEASERATTKRRLRAALREALGVSLTDREIAKTLARARADRADEADERRDE